MTAQMVEIVPPIGDGCWWLVQCHTCREIVGRAVESRYDAERRARAHQTDHADGTIARRRAARR